MLTLQDLALSRGGRRVIGELCAGADRGDAVALLGPNGAGKTTLLHSIAGILKIDTGSISYKSSTIDPASRDWRLKLSYVLDDGGIIPLLTVEEQLYLQAVLTGVSHVESLDRLNHVIELLELGKYRDYRGEELSTGLRKRLGLGLGLIRDAEVFLFDEPYSSLDVQGAAVFNQIILELKRKERITLVASHSFPFPDSLYNRIWSLSAGVLKDYTAEAEIRDFLKGSAGSADSAGNREIEIPWIQKPA